MTLQDKDLAAHPATTLILKKREWLITENIFHNCNAKIWKYTENTNAAFFWGVWGEELHC